MHAKCARTTANRFSSTIRCASAALSLPFIASDVRAAMTSWTARPNCHTFRGDFRRSGSNLTSTLVRNLNIMVITLAIGLINNVILERQFLIRDFEMGQEVSGSVAAQSRTGLGARLSR